MIDSEVEAAIRKLGLEVVDHMAYHDDLLQEAFDLVERNPGNAKQADLRRAASAAYFALFHLLISEAVAHWNMDRSRESLARMFDHKIMVKASEKIRTTIGTRPRS